MSVNFKEILKAKKLQKREEDSLLKEMDKYFSDWLDKIRMTTKITVVKSSMFYDFVKEQLERQFEDKHISEEDKLQGVEGSWKIVKRFARSAWIRAEKNNQIRRRENTSLFDLPHI